MKKRAGKVARQQRVMAQLFNQQLGVQANEHFVFDDKNDGHQREICCEFGIVIRPPMPDPYRHPQLNSRQRKRFQRLSVFTIL